MKLMPAVPIAKGGCGKPIGFVNIGPEITVIAYDFGVPYRRCWRSPPGIFGIVNMCAPDIDAGGRDAYVGDLSDFTISCWLNGFRMPMLQGYLLH